MKVGFLDLKKVENNIFKLRSEIERLSENKWLDTETSRDYFIRSHDMKDPISLSMLRDQLKSEIKWRRKQYGNDK